jgi:hypothetical protein
MLLYSSAAPAAAGRAASQWVAVVAAAPAAAATRRVLLAWGRLYSCSTCRRLALQLLLLQQATQSTSQWDSAPAWVESLTKHHHQQAPLHSLLQHQGQKQQQL